MAASSGGAICGGSADMRNRRWWIEKLSGSKTEPSLETVFKTADRQHQRRSLLVDFIGNDCRCQFCPVEGSCHSKLIHAEEDLSEIPAIKSRQISRSEMNDCQSESCEPLDSRKVENDGHWPREKEDERHSVGHPVVEPATMRYGPHRRRRTGKKTCKGRESALTECQSTART